MYMRKMMLQNVIFCRRYNIGRIMKYCATLTDLTQSATDYNMEYGWYLNITTNDKLT